MRGQRLFFATRDDLLPGLKAIESEWAIEYQLREMGDDPNFVVLSSLLDAPEIGTSKTGGATSDDEYLMYPRDARPPVRSIAQRRGGVTYDLELSPDLLSMPTSAASPCTRPSRKPCSLDSGGSSSNWSAPRRTAT